MAESRCWSVGVGDDRKPTETDDNSPRHRGSLTSHTIIAFWVGKQEVDRDSADYLGMSRKMTKFQERTDRRMTRRFAKCFADRATVDRHSVGYGCRNSLVPGSCRLLVAVVVVMVVMEVVGLGEGGGEATIYLANFNTTANRNDVDSSTRCRRTRASRKALCRSIVDTAGFRAIAGRPATTEAERVLEAAQAKTRGSDSERRRVRKSRGLRQHILQQHQ
jgi:hypothetical protein